MSRDPTIPRYLLPCLALMSIVSGCQSIPVTDVSISSKSSLLAVDVRYPFPLSRDPSLVQVFFVKGIIHSGLKEIPELIPATFVKGDRAYLLDPEPGTYCVVAVTARVAPPWNNYPVAGGVTQTVWNGHIGHAMILPTELIRQTATTIGPGDVAFVGALRVLQGSRINAGTVFADDVQKRITERIRPGVTSESGLTGWITLTYLADPEASWVSDEWADRTSFYDAALTDLGVSPWAQVIARAAPGYATTARSTTLAPSPSPTGTSPSPDAAASKPQAAMPDSNTETTEHQVAIPEPLVAVVAPEAAAPAPRAAPPKPQRRRFTGLPEGSPLAKLEFGMHHDEVRRILGEPDERSRRATTKAWIPFYSGPGAHRVDWIYDGVGRVTFSLHGGSLEVLEVVPGSDPK